MIVRDLGELDTPVVVFGGPYSNLQATRAMRSVADRLGIAASHAICTGDVVAYCAEPAETVAEIRGWGCPVVAGNCERQLAEDAPDCGCGFEEGSTCDRLSASWFAHARGQIGPRDRDWMRDLPDMITFRQAGRRFAVIHGGLSDISRFLWPTSPEVAFEEEIALISSVAGPIDGVIAGHCGLAFMRDIGGIQWMNAGVIGMPPNDAESATRYILLKDGRGTIQRLDYDSQAARAAMERAGLVQGYQIGLTSGVWPSQDILPTDLRYRPAPADSRVSDAAAK